MSDSIWDTITGVISKVAPTVATAILGPAGGAAVNGLCSILGINTESSPDEVETALQKATPEQWLKIKEFELEYKKQEVREAEIAKEDRDSARNREIEIKKTGAKDYMPAFIAIVVSVAIIGAMISIMFFGKHINLQLKEVIVFMLGCIFGAFSSIVNYYFGTSKSSSDKTKMIEKMHY